MTQRLERSEQFKLKSVEMSYRADGSETYRVEAFPQYGQGWSKYQRRMFIHGDQEAQQALYKQLRAVSEGAVLKLNVVSGSVREGKQDDGKPDSYYWNVTGIADGATPTPEPQAKPQPQPTAKDAPWDPRDTQARISWAQAINLAVAALGPKGAMVFSPSTMRTELATNTVERLANQFYPLILRGPGHQQPETQDAEETPQDDGDHDADQDDADLTPPVQPQRASTKSLGDTPAPFWKRVNERKLNRDKVLACFPGGMGKFLDEGGTWDQAWEQVEREMLA